MKNLKDYSILILAAGKGRRLKNIGKKTQNVNSNF